MARCRKISSSTTPDLAILSLYGHLLQKPSLQPGQEVQAGQLSPSAAIPPKHAMAAPICISKSVITLTILEV